ncbi:Deoxyuridine 5'-triphosphate nucleotidohydrolase, mitochondrial [Toxocara canis]|uniref:Deoxyuridine 5'-triphosphate nucleotidohydrolase n=1 Tax=Toxocara canis TaxID=6265 RepID=A0A0B2VBU0_TOXCA|nr:Deoxyuridine 5'-triphosphate nucleotidohydrolase, mitochondrial [Toxocara canis]
METENVPPVVNKSPSSGPETKKARGDSNESVLGSSVNERCSTDESKKLQIRFAKLSENAFAPTYGSEWAAGADLYSACDCTVPPKGKFVVPTDLQLEIPIGYYGRVAPRSGLATKNFIDVGAGVVDADYRGNVKILLFNFGDEPFEVRKGDRIAQLICERIAHCDFVELSSLEETSRGTGGFGSTGQPSCLVERSRRQYGRDTTNTWSNRKAPSTLKAPREIHLLSVLEAAIMPGRKVVSCDGQETAPEW